MKNKISILFFYLLAFNLMNALPFIKGEDFFDKYQKATIHFLDGTSIEGYGKLTGIIDKYKIKFKASKESKPDVWTDLMVKGITFHYEFEDVTFIYVKLSEKTYPLLLQLVEEGAVSLYIDISSNWTNLGFDSKTGFPLHQDYEQSITYFLKRDDNYSTLKLTNTSSIWNGTIKNISFSFKKRIKRFFDDCDGIKNKLDSGDFNRNTIPEIVYYYNDFCTEL